MKKSLLALLAALLATNAVVLITLLKSPARSAPSNVVSAAMENPSDHKSRNPQPSEALTDEQMRKSIQSTINVIKMIGRHPNISRTFSRR